ncbi:hypothetical protein H106_02518 [Trichophyton rubrum CBS 735.88]|nr:hypothetical protein H106_02518 [Trichophyton rubrum CBS 735.88]
MRSLTLDGCRLMTERCGPLLSSQFVALRNYSQSLPAKSLFQPSQAQLLRFAITGTTCSGPGDRLDKKLDERLKSQFQKNRLPKRLSTIDPLSPPLPKLPKGHGLSRLQADVETFINSESSGANLLKSIQSLENALDQCHTRVEGEDLLMTINGLLARLNRLGVKDTHQLLLLGMSYAAENFSSGSLAVYLRNYSKGGHGTLPRSISVSLIDSLLNGFKRRYWEDPSIDKSAMLRVIIGPGTEPTSADTLHSHLDFSSIRESEVLPKYLQLLGELGGEKIVFDLWRQVQAELEYGQTAAITESAIASIEAFLTLGNPGRALEAAQLASKYIDLNEHLPALTWKLLLEHDSHGLLRTVIAPATTATLLQRDIHSLELVLGATWFNDGAGHHYYPLNMEEIHSTSAANDSYQPSYNPSEYTSSVKFIRQLQGGMQKNGCSRPLDNLTAIADLLDEYEGVDIPLKIQLHENFDTLDYAWFPSCSPVEFVGNRPQLGRDIGQPLSPSSLGLISVHVDGNGVPIRSLGNVSLMQLGCIGVRASVANATGLCDSIERWRCTGHIIAWDRQSGKVVALWIGKGNGVVRPGLVKPTPPLELPFIFGTVTISDTEEAIISQCDRLGPLNNKQSYWVDVDSSSNLLK